VVTRAEHLGITRGPLWIIGHSDEENALVDPISDNIEVVIDEQDGDEDDQDVQEDEEVEAAIVVVDDPDTLAAELDDALPRVGAVPIVWVALPRSTADLTVDTVTAAIDDYGWSVSDRVELGSAWIALRVTPA